ncbi:hypothetical protein TNCV_1229521 [Trichonephila clavipes]|nr:hypothetical protein TNCV_1229521 [Trichonephila clavipes]
MVVSGCSAFHSQIVALSLYTGLRWRYYTLENALMGDFGFFSSGRKDKESCRLFEHDCRSIAPLYGVCFLNRKKEIPAGQRLMPKS